MGRLAGISALDWTAFVRSRQSQIHSPTQAERKATLCKTCFTPIRPGIDHPEEKCRKKTTKVLNLTETLDENTMEHLVVEYMRKKVGESGDLTFQLGGAFGGRPTTISGGKPVKKSKEMLGIAEAVAIRSEGGMSTRKMKVVLKNMRFAGVEVEPYLELKLRIHNRCFKDLYKLEIVQI